MNIMVFDVPAEHGGALSILKDFYNEVKENDNKINWIFIISTPKLEETENIKVLRFPWVKKSWAHRLYFDNIIAPYLVNKYRVEKVISFQNITIPFTNVPQILYVHQPLPFVKYRFSFNENKKFWVYQNLIGRKIVSSIKKSTKVIIQTRWMKEACINYSGSNQGKFHIIPPKVSIPTHYFFKPSNNSLSTFFYPASGIYYKNHRVVIEACKKINSKSLESINIIFTLNGDENDHISKLYREVQELQLPIKFIGSLEREDVYKMYTNSVLLFPSYIETFGLPMLEAKVLKCMILASDCPFSHDILDEYENAFYFDPFNAESLAMLMLDVTKRVIDYVEIKSAVEQTIHWDNLSISEIIEQSR